MAIDARQIGRNVAAICVATALCALSGGSAYAGDEGPDRAGELFREMQRHFDKGEHEEVIRVGKQINVVDKYGEK